MRVAWVPPVRVEMVRVALSEPLSAYVPRLVAPSKNWTLPVGVPPALVTWAVKVSESPNVEGLAPLVRLRAVVVVA